MMKHMIRDQEGSILIIVVVTVMFVASMAFAFLSISTTGASETTRAVEYIERFYIAQAGVSAAMSEVGAAVDYDGDGLGNVTADFAGGEYNVTAIRNGNLWTLLSVGTDATDHERAIEVMAEYAVVPLSANTMAAVTSMAPVDVSGNITVDGRDHDMDGNLIGPGIDGVVCGGAVSSGGNAGIGGNGIAPVNRPVEADGVFGENFDFSGIYPSGYPDNPDDILGLPQGTLRAAAQAQGTLFTNQTDWDDFLAANGGVSPGGAIIYLDFDECVPTEIGSSLNDPPSILIMHNSTGDANMKNVHGKFRGLLLADSITHVNANSMIVGAIQTTWPLSIGNSFGNGNSDILFSSEALANLPGVTTGNGALNIVSWREVSPP